VGGMGGGGGEGDADSPSQTEDRAPGASACTDVWSIIKIDALQHLTPAKAEFGGYGGIPGFEELAEGEGTERRTEVTRRDTGTRDP
jgi:hypothetical protein